MMYAFLSLAAWLCGRENCVSASAIVLSHLIAHILYLAFDSQNVILGLLEFTNY